MEKANRKSKVREMVTLSEEEIKKKRFRVSCLNITEGGSIPLIPEKTYLPEGGVEAVVHGWLCGAGHGMTIDEMNERLVWKGRPYIEIPYCKYCDTSESLGILTDDARMFGWEILPPGSDRKYYSLRGPSEKVQEIFMKRKSPELIFFERD